MATVVPLTSNTAHVFAFRVLVEPDESDVPRESKARAEQVRSVSVRRLDGDPVGKLSTRTLAALDEALRLHLDLRGVVGAFPVLCFRATAPRCREDEVLGSGAVPMSVSLC
ncbi:type II toxin-antitoxin system PemK/MazF family toxin [Rhodococcus sp. C26F]